MNGETSGHSPSLPPVVSSSALGDVFLLSISTMPNTLSHEDISQIAAEVVARMIHPPSTSGSGNLLSTGGGASSSAGSVPPMPVNTNPGNAG